MVCVVLSWWDAPAPLQQLLQSWLQHQPLAQDYAGRKGRTWHFPASGFKPHWTVVLLRIKNFHTSGFPSLPPQAAAVDQMLCTFLLSPFTFGAGIFPSSLHVLCFKRIFLECREEGRSYQCTNHPRFGIHLFPEMCLELALMLCCCLWGMLAAPWTETLHLGKLKSDISVWLFFDIFTLSHSFRPNSESRQRGTQVSQDMTWGFFKFRKMS